MQAYRGRGGVASSICQTTT